MNHIDVLKKAGVIPVITFNDHRKAPYVADALLEGGVTCAEVTFRTGEAEAAIRLISKTHGNFYLAAGTVLTKEQADRAAEAGAKVLVSPGFNPELTAYCAKIGIPFVPGAATPSEIDAVLRSGIDFMKFFPAEAMGGVNYLKAVSAPYGMASFMPTGGITPGNIKDYLSLKQVICCGGTFIAPSKLIDSGDYGEIAKLALKASEAVKEAGK